MDDTPQRQLEEKEQSWNMKIKAWISKITHHPLFGITIGAIIAFITWYDTIKKPELTYYVSSTRTAILQKGSLTNLSVAYRGVPIDGDLSAVEVQIWNHGKQAIHGGDREHGGDILEPIVLYAANFVTNPVPLYEMTVSSSRKAIGAEQIQINYPVLRYSGGVPIILKYWSKTM